MTAELRSLLADCAKALTTARLHYEFEATVRPEALTLHLAKQARELVGRIEAMTTEQEQPS